MVIFRQNIRIEYSPFFMGSRGHGMVMATVMLERKDVACQTLRAALSKAEAAYPGFTYDLVMELVRKADLSVNMNEAILRLQGSVNDMEGDYRVTRAEDTFQELNKKSANLKRILARIPEEITDRKTFLETIKEIASAIKKLLDAVSEVSQFIPGTQGKQALEHRKRDFVKHSKKFSNTLKEYFKEGQANAVFVSATYLIHQTNLIMITVKDKCE
ncbi:programmed cell death protein 10 Ccm3 isoform X3 [Oratosquilla oratoria]|uniref:programmed cell death protein 10 Ccm3 isoform X3 n=1 Tax=Oratosquilla oratoria TaxID=337810 RepID=UPI003F761EF1